MIELNVNPIGPDGQPAPQPVITLYVLDKAFAECPMEPRIRQQSNFYAADIPFAQATGRQGPFTIYGSVAAAGMNTGYLPMTPWDGTQTITIPVQLSFKKPFRAAPRYWNGVNMCGDHYDGLPAVPGGAADPTLFLSWFYDRYDANWRAQLRAANRAKFRTHWLLSWPDSRAQGATPESFKTLCQELIASGFYPCVMLTSKDFDPPDVPAILADVLPLLDVLVGTVPMFCVGWELSLWLSPAQVQALIDVMAPSVQRQAGTLLYVHFQAGYSSFQPDGTTFATFWNANVGKLNGVLHQKVPSQTREQYQFDSGGLHDVLVRFAGGFFCSPDDGTGHPFDCVALEITASQQYDGHMSTADGDTWGDTALATPAVVGPLGPVGVMGSGNGFT